MPEVNLPTVKEAPVADWFDPHSAMKDPYPLYDRLREAGPVVFVPAIKRYLFTSHCAVGEAERHPEIFSSYSESNLTMMHALGGRPMLRKNDPDHAIERTAINPTLRPKSIKTVWSPNFESNVDRWLDHLSDVGSQSADLNRDFAAPVASQNLINIVGFPSDVEVDDMHRWSTDYIAGIGNLLDEPEIWQRCDRSQEEVNAILDDLLPSLRRRPDHSVTSHLLQVGLPEETVRANVHLTISGGMNEPQHMITNMVWALSRHSEQKAGVLTGNVPWGEAFEETVRWQSPIGMIPREAIVDSVVQGTFVPAGANVGLVLASANRDETVFDRAARFDVHRRARGHVGFGSGTHMCAGRWAAKSAVGEFAVPRLYERFPDLALALGREVQWDGWVFRGITSLPVTW